MSGDDVHSDASVPEPSSRRSDSDEEPEPDILDGGFLYPSKQRAYNRCDIKTGVLQQKWCE